MPSIGFPELIVILVIALIVLGPKKLPEAGRAMGKGMREFKDSLSGMTDHDDDEDHRRPAVTASETPIAAPAPRFDPMTGEPLTPEAQRERDAVSSQS